MDDLDFEVTPLGRDARPSEPSAPAEGERNGREASGVAMTRSPLAPRLTRRTRLRRTGAVVALLLAGLVALVAFDPDLHAALPVLLGATPTPGSPANGGEGQLYWENSVPWGDFLVDGARGPELRFTGPTGGTAGPIPTLPSFTLPRGRHTLDYRAAPFAPLHCTLTVPAAHGDTCPLAGDAPDFLTKGAPRARLLDFGAALDRMPLDAYAQLVDAAGAALDQAAGADGRGAVAAGDHYLAPGGVATAATPLVASPRFTLLDGPPPGGSDGPFLCRPLCGPDLFTRSGPRGWTVAATLVASWHYRSRDGQVIADNVPAAVNPLDAVVSQPLAVLWLGDHWSVGIGAEDQPRINPVLCTVAAQSLARLRASIGPGAPGSDYQWPFTASTAGPGAGCALAGSNLLDPAGGVFQDQAAVVVYRCGALVVANDLARRVFPDLPAASAHEQALARDAVPFARVGLSG